MIPFRTRTGRYELIAIDTVAQIQFGHRWFPQPYVMPNGDWIVTFSWTDDAYFAKGGLLRSRDKGKSWSEEGIRTDSGVLTHLGGDHYAFFDSYYPLHKTGDDFVCQGTFSEDGGKTWGPVNFHIPFNCPGAVVYSLADMMKLYFTLPTYPWNRFFAANGYPMTSPGWPGTARKIRFGGAGPSQHTVALDDGRLISMNYCRGKPPAGVNVDYFFAYALESADRGRTWRHVGNVPWTPEFKGEEALFGNTGFTEASIARVKGGELLIVLRAGSHLPMGMSRSNDFGRTWTKPQFIRLKNTDTPAAGILPTLCRTARPADALACVYGRPGVHLITDATGTGNEWEHEIDLIDVERKLCRQRGAPDNFYSTENAGMTELLPGELGVTYELTGWTESKDKPWMRQTIRMARLRAV